METRLAGGMNWEIRIKIYSLLCVKYITSENLLSSTEDLSQCFVVT